MLGLVLIIACAVVFYKAADIENLDQPLLWAVGSVVMYIGMSMLTGLGFIGGLLGQLLLFIWMGVWLYLQSRKRV